MSESLGADRRSLERRVEQVSQAMAAHGGGIELVSVDVRGSVRLRFTVCAPAVSCDP